MKSQGAFAKAQKLNFQLLSDPDAGVTRKYDVMMDGRPFSQRVTFFIDPEGVLRHIDESVKVDSHGGDVVAVLKRLQQ